MHFSSVFDFPHNESMRGDLRWASASKLAASMISEATAADGPSSSAYIKETKVVIFHWRGLAYHSFRQNFKVLLFKRGEKMSFGTF